MSEAPKFRCDECPKRQRFCRGLCKACYCRWWRRKRKERRNGDG